MRPSPVVVTISVLALGLAAAAGWLYHRGQPQTAGQSVTGELVEYTGTRNDLALRTGNLEEHFVVPGSTPVHEGARDITVAELATANGCPAKIRYRQLDGQRVAVDIRISCAGVSRPAGSGTPRSRQP